MVFVTVRDVSDTHRFSSSQMQTVASSVTSDKECHVVYQCEESSDEASSLLTATLHAGLNRKENESLPVRSYFIQKIIKGQ